MINHINVIGILAAILTSSSFVPQIIKIHHTKHTADLSLPMYIIFFCGISLWLVYGILIHSLPVIAANIFSLIFCADIVIMKVRYK